MPMHLTGKDLCLIFGFARVEKMEITWASTKRAVALAKVLKCPCNSGEVQK
jgi:hypothetical protein